MFPTNLYQLLGDLLKASLLIGLTLGSTTVYAEYYFSYSMPEVCVSCYKKSSAPKKHHVYKKKIQPAKQVVKKTTPKKHYRTYTTHCETYRPGNGGWVPGYWINGYWVRASYFKYYEEPSYRHAHHKGRYNTHRYDDYDYNPDMTTGDDDTFVNPNMNIDY